MKLVFSDYDQHADVLIRAALQAADPATAVACEDAGRNADILRTNEKGRG
jgi:hypothetical protein